MPQTFPVLPEPPESLKALNLLAALKMPVPEAESVWSLFYGDFRPTFADSFAGRRCALPAAGFYEWDKKKEKVIFTLPDRPILYLAGIYRPYGAENRFVVLTREANASMEPVHDRMPLILSGEEVLPWVSDAAKASDILTKELPMLKAERPYEQISFEFE